MMHAMRPDFLEGLETPGLNLKVVSEMLHGVLDLLDAPDECVPAVERRADFWHAAGVAVRWGIIIGCGEARHSKGEHVLIPERVPERLRNDLRDLLAVSSRADVYRAADEALMEEGYEGAMLDWLDRVFSEAWAWPGREFGGLAYAEFMCSVRALYNAACSGDLRVCSGELRVVINDMRKECGGRLPVRYITSSREDSDVSLNRWGLTLTDSTGAKHSLATPGGAAAAAHDFRFACFECDLLTEGRSKGDPAVDHFLDALSHLEMAERAFRRSSVAASTRKGVGNE